MRKNIPQKSITLSSKSVGDHHRLLLLRHLLLYGPTSRAELARSLGLAPSVVSRLVRELLVEGYLVERDPIKTNNIGRRPILLKFNPDHKTVIGGHVQTGKIECALLNLGGQVLARWESRVVEPPIPEQVFDLLQKAVLALRQENTLGIGVAISGLVDAQSGRIVFSPVLQWNDVDMREEIQKRCGLPVFVENDANVLAVAERFHGAGRNYKNFICVMISDGLGAGIVLDGRLYRGMLGAAGEVGHTTIDPSEQAPVCRCGERGCLEEFCSKRALNREAQKLGLFDWQALGEAARAGNKQAKEAFLRFGYLLGLGLKNLVNVLNPEAMIIGGDLAECADLFMPITTKIIRAHSFPEGRAAPDVVLWQVGKEGFLVGAGGLVIEEFLSSPIRA